MIDKKYIDLYLSYPVNISSPPSPVKITFSLIFLLKIKFAIEFWLPTGSSSSSTIFSILSIKSVCETFICIFS